MSSFAIAIDGPAGSGKSTVAKAAAKEFEIVYVDTGAMYRAVALFCMRRNIDTKSEEEVSKILPEIKMGIKNIEGVQKIYLDEEDVTDKIRTQEVGQGASDVGLILSVRNKLAQIQRNLAKDTSVIMDGRDIGTNVLPDAQVKIYLNASVEERTKRRLGELLEKGIKAEEEEVRQQILFRDENDITRKHNPLRKADDAVEIDSTKMSIEMVVEEIIKIKKEKIGE